MSMFRMSRPMWLARALVSVAAWLLPVRQRERYLLEWMAELEQYSLEGLAVVYPALRILCGAPAVRHALVQAGQSSGDPSLRPAFPSEGAEALPRVRRDAKAIAELIAATETRPPLAIALTGGWGSGKSSMMLQVQAAIDALAKQSRNNPGVSAFAGSVRHVRFNAWHYNGDHLWAGLVSQLFQVLAIPDLPSADAPIPDTAQIKRERDRLSASLKDWQHKYDRLDARLRLTDGRSRPVGFLTVLGLLKKMTQYLAAGAWLAARDLCARLSILVTWVILGGAAYVAWHSSGTRAGIAVTGVAGLIALVAPVLVTLRSCHKAVIRFAAEQRGRLITRRRDTQEEIYRLQDRLVLIDAAVRLSAVLDEHGAPATYGGYQDLLGRVRADLEQLSTDLARARGERAASGCPIPSPLERLVLYIDDLDRCPPMQVVEALEAVHVMLALDLFVVVVAADARWLIQSLKDRHHELFSTGMPGTAEAMAEDDRERLAAAIDLLDKIFQVHYVLPPPTPEADGPAPEQLNRLAGGEQAGDTNGDVIHVDLGPRGFRLSEAEIKFLSRLGGLLPTPRAAKRMVSIYRLVRISIPGKDLPAFPGDEEGGLYQAVLVLLAILAGSPAVARDVFRALLKAPPTDNILNVLQGMDDAAVDQGQLSRIRNEIAALGTTVGLSLTAADCQQWCSVLARYSFRTRDLAETII